MSKHDDLVKKLKEIFQIDRPELDFGVYRILNARVVEINDYLENRLKAKVDQSLAASGAANKESVQKELKEKEAQYRSDGIDPETVPKVRELRQKLTDYGVGTSEHENAVFTHLLTFFSRYYDSGDFISQRRYKGDTYAIPYAGEEVVLHWANKDQYYTKSGENFSNYAFKLDDGRSVRFRLVTADTAKDNRKDNDKERRFVLIEAATRTLTDDEGEEYEQQLSPVAEENGELVLRFEYKAMPKGTKQDVLVADAVKTILQTLSPLGRGQGEGKYDWHTALSKREPTEKNPQRTLLEKCLTSYTAKNSADYFIHKDLGGFLRRELDFYIKNEVMHLDDVQHAETFADIEKNLRLIQTLRAIALDLITFLAQLEEFQLKLWLKKKFVVSTHYCMTLDRIIKDAPNLLDVIAANQKQWEQWENLGMLNSKVDLFNQTKVGSIEYLKEHPSLMADTALFDDAFKQSLLAAVDNLDESLDGLLIHGDNFQALNLLEQAFRERITTTFIDPPYNTGVDDFLYKDRYSHSSWATFLENRVELARKLFSEKSLFFMTTDSVEVATARFVCDSIFGSNNFIADVAWEKRYTRSNNAKKYYSLKDTVTVYRNCELLDEIKESRSDSSKGNYTNPTKDPRGDWISSSYVNPAEKSKRPNLVYKITNPFSGLEIEHPTHAWKYDIETHRKHVADDRLYWGLDGGYEYPRLKSFLSVAKDGMVPVDVWSYEDAGTTDEGGLLLKQLFGFAAFDNPKPVKLIKKCIQHITGETKHPLILDFFAGSGTTAHAVIESFRESQQQKKKYILIEQGDYFDNIIKPRVQKVVYSADWKDGKPTAPHTGISHAFKVIKLESYEDTLNNLQLRRTAQQSSLLDMLPQSAQEDYLLRYLLDIESRGSLLSVEQFNQPFDCKLKVTVDSAGAYEERTIDLVETFNYLIGLRVKHIDMQRDKGFVSVTGWLPTGEKTLVLWRDVAQVDYETLNRLCDKLAINPADSEFDIVYINGDHNIPAVFTSLETEGGITKTLKIRQIEPEFLNRMFAVEGV